MRGSRRTVLPVQALDKMKAVFTPGTAYGKITVPPSKSFTHRYLIASALCDMPCTISNILISDDTKATINCLRSLGAEIKIDGNTAVVTKKIEIPEGSILCCGESGSTLRMLMPLCMCGKHVTFETDESLSKRPMTVYEDICQNQDIKYIHDGNHTTVSGTLKSGEFSIKGNISSQFISGLLFALPLLEGDSRINIEKPIESLPYIDMTLLVLNEFGIECYWDSSSSIFVKGSQEYKCFNPIIEGDWSNGAFYKALNTIGSNVEICGLDSESIQGDSAVVNRLKGIERGFPLIDISNCPDIGPLLFSVAAAKNGAAFKGTERLRIKESDRLGCMDEELNKLGITMTYSDDFVKVNNWCVHTPDVPLSGHGDHRVIMALSLVLSVYGGTLIGVEAVKKSYPEFFDDLKKIGINVTLEDD